MLVYETLGNKDYEGAKNPERKIWGNIDTLEDKYRYYNNELK